MTSYVPSVLDDVILKVEFWNRKKMLSPISKFVLREYGIPNLLYYISSENSIFKFLISFDSVSATYSE